MSVIKQMIPRELVEFQDELKYHPKLVEQIRLEAKTFEEGLAMACTYVGVVVDGLYDVAPMCAMLVKRLQACRHVIVVEEISRTSLADDAEYVQCDKCGRKSWGDIADVVCNMTQPTGERCDGVLKSTTPSGESLLILPPKLQ